MGGGSATGRVPGQTSAPSGSSGLLARGSTGQRESAADLAETCVRAHDRVSRGLRRTTTILRRRPAAPSAVRRRAGRHCTTSTRATPTLRRTSSIAAPSSSRDSVCVRGPLAFGRISDSSAMTLPAIGGCLRGARPRGDQRSKGGAVSGLGPGVVDASFVSSLTIRIESSGAVGQSETPLGAAGALCIPRRRVVGGWAGDGALAARGAWLGKCVGVEHTQGVLRACSRRRAQAVKRVERPPSASVQAHGPCLCSLVVHWCSHAMWWQRPEGPALIFLPLGAVCV